MERTIIVFDTETTSLVKPFCYNVGWVVARLEENGSYHILEEKEFMCKQVWYNTMLFSTAYYADKKALYHDRIKQHFIEVKRVEEVMEILSKSIEYYNIDFGYAYNASFDIKVFQFMSDWFRTPNPIAEIPVYDIRAYFMHLVDGKESFAEFCEEYERFTESGNYSTTAETAFQYMENIPGFEEEHTALADSEIELMILSDCAEHGEDIFHYVKTKKSLPRRVQKDYTIQYQNKDYTLKGYSATWYKNKNKLVIK